MALPDLNAFCFPIAAAEPLCVTFPGGAQFCAQTPNPPTPLNLSISMLAQISVALAPLQPLFLLLDVIVAIVDCIKAVEGCLGPPPNPTKLIACLPKLAAAIAALLGLLPPLTVPLMIVGILETVLAFLKGLRAEILYIIQFLMKLLAVNLRIQVTGSLQLQIAADCASNNMTGYLSTLALALQPLTCLLALINALFGLIGLPVLNLSLSLGVDLSGLEALVTPIDDIIAIIQAILDALPLNGTC
jgi:hypothetical protein